MSPHSEEEKQHFEHLVPAFSLCSQWADVESLIVCLLVRGDN